MLLASADYQFELRLISYNNPRGFTEDLNCCDAQFSPQTCVPQDQCDTEFFIRLRNFDRGSAQLGSTKLVGVYQDMNMISFPSCGALTGNFDNPLVYTFPTSQFTTGPGFTGVSNLFTIMGPFWTTICREFVLFSIECVHEYNTLSLSFVG